MKYTTGNKNPKLSPRSLQQFACNLPKKSSPKYLSSQKDQCTSFKPLSQNCSSQKGPGEFPKATDYIARSPGEVTPYSTHSMKTDLNSVEIRLLQAPSGTYLNRKHSTSPPSRNSSIYSKFGEGTTTRVRERQLEDIIEKMRSELDKYRITIEQNKNTWRVIQNELKSTANAYMKQAQDSKAELEKIKSLNLKYEEKLKTSLSDSRKSIDFAIRHLSECKNYIQNSQICFIKSLHTANSNIDSQDKVNAIKKCLTDGLGTLIDLEPIKNFISSLEAYRETANYTKSMENDVQPKVFTPDTNTEQLRNTNAILLEHILQLERAIGEMESTKAIRDTDMCWGIKEIMNLCKEKEQLSSMHNALKAKYDAYLKRPIQPSKISKLAQILAYLPKRRKILKAQQDTFAVELREEINRLKKEIERRDEEAMNRYNELLNRYNLLMGKYATLEEENSGLRLENAELRRKIEELLGLIRLKDAIIESLKKELELAKQQIDRLLREIQKHQGDLREKDLFFADKMKEMKQMFEELLKEKDNKQKEIILSKEKIDKLEKELVELRTKLGEALNEISILTEENARLSGEIEQYFSTGTLDGFRALVSLANMILARTKRPPPLSTKDKLLIKDIFNANIRGMLDEIARQQEESKLYREELRKLLSQRDMLINVCRTGRGKVN